MFSQIAKRVKAYRDYRSVLGQLSQMTRHELEDIGLTRGDIEEADESIEHQPFAGKEADCICLAVTDAPLRFKSLLVRLVQPFLQI